METDNLRLRAKRKRIRVTFPDGKVICFSNVTETFIATLCEIGSERFQEIHLDLSHLPILSQEIYPRFKNWMKPVCDGWFLNSQSNTDQKYLQLLSINDSLNLGLKIEIGEDFEKQVNPNKTKGKKTKEQMSVTFPDGTVISSQNGIDTFLQSLEKIGFENIMRKGLEWCSKPIISNYKMFNQQVQASSNRWITVPTTTKEKARLLKLVSLHLRINLDITIL